MVRLPIDASPLLISIATTCAATVATFFLGLLAAWWMYRAQTGDEARRGGLWGWGLRGLGLRGLGLRALGLRALGLRSWIDGILTLPLVLPPTVVGFFLLLLFGRRSLLGAALERLGITIVFSWPATVIAATVVAFPLMYRTALGAFEQVNPTLLQAARTLGASEWKVFRKVLFPLAAPGVVAGTMLAFARAMGEFGATLMLAGDIPGRTETMPIAIYSAVEDNNMRLAAVWVVLIVAISLGMIRLLNRQGKTARRRMRVEVRPRGATVAGMLPTVPRSRAQDEAERARPYGLEIDLEKGLERFRLRVRLRAGRGAMGMLGASGAGKSMTLRLIAGVVQPDKGRIVLNGRVLYDSATGENVRCARRRIGIVFQDYALFPHMTVEENVGFGLGALTQAERRRTVARHLERMHIAELARCRPGEISGGQRQRVAIARCMATEPDALLLDEPFAALDPHLRRQTEEQLRETLAEYRGAVLFVTHDMEEAFRFCKELTVLDDGRVIASGPKNEIFERPRSVAAARLTGCKNIVLARRSGVNRMTVDAWQCELRTAGPIPDGLTHVGMRSHQIGVVPEGAGENVFAGWLAGSSEAPHEMTLYLRLHAPASDGEPAHLQVDMAKDAARALMALPQPWMVRLDPARLLLLEG